MDEEGVRNREGVVGVDADDGIELRVDGAGKLFLIFFFAGKEGNGALGGPPLGDGGNEGRGRVEVAIIGHSDLVICEKARVYCFKSLLLQRCALEWL